MQQQAQRPHIAVYGKPKNMAEYWNRLCRLCLCVFISEYIFHDISFLSRFLHMAQCNLAFVFVCFVSFPSIIWSGGCCRLSNDVLYFYWNLFSFCIFLSCANSFRKDSVFRTASFLHWRCWVRAKNRDLKSSSLWLPWKISNLPLKFWKRKRNKRHLMKHKKNWIELFSLDDTQKYAQTAWFHWKSMCQWIAWQQMTAPQQQRVHLNWWANRCILQIIQTAESFRLDICLCHGCLLFFALDSFQSIISNCMKVAPCVV